jgi:hypothetical protein
MRLVLRILIRCLSLLVPVRKHVILLFLGFGTLSLLLLPLGLLFVDTLWTRVLQGNPMLEIEAQFFRVPVAAATHVDSFGPDLRRLVAQRLVVWAAGLSMAIAPVFIGLYYYQV